MTSTALSVEPRSARVCPVDDSDVDLDLAHVYRDKRVFITGGLGFLGSTLARRLVGYGAHVSIVDSLNPLYGGNRYNIDGLDGRLQTLVGDARDIAAIRPHLQEADCIFHLAAQVSYIDSLNMPIEDLQVNAGLTLQLLEECRQRTVKPRFVFASSRMVLGRAGCACPDEDEPAKPLTLYGVHKFASERYLAIYHQNFGIPTLTLRITNPYGPRQQIHHSKYAMVGWFVRQALEGTTIRVFGDGAQRRDYIYIDDLAEAFLRCTVARGAAGEVVNIGSGVGTRFRDMVETVVDVVGRGRVECVPWPQDYERVETGDFVADLSKLERLTGWSSRIDLRTGIERTVEYYRRAWHEYVR
jgi:UDP-glucose 4-epimerase